MFPSIIPPGFERTAHPVFGRYRRPTLRCATEIVGDSAATRKRHKSDSESPTSSTASTISNHSHPLLQTENALLCSICLQVYSDPVTLVRCRHHFCFVCIDAWFSVNTICPLCKSTDVHFLRANATSQLAVPSAKPSALFSDNTVFHDTTKASDLELWTYYTNEEQKPKLRMSADQIRMAVESHFDCMALVVADNLFRSQILLPTSCLVLDRRNELSLLPIVIVEFRVCKTLTCFWSS
jgi:hypothetical protein